ncbi:pilus assembly protein [Micromonospora soli]|uniref:TadE family protein n=1 Tax=Micromonospora sp. NBRC 110009 TaxID=3061627 RepID=UPI002671541A|nr:TadE family protein [Micromonospora sp. NBRC 110009]WKU01103.1 pilus assembly protein [Micromonospora sp. NBRC 110009]
MALVLPLLLVLIFGIIDFGRMLNRQIVLTEAARDAARVASFGGGAKARAERIGGKDVNVVVGDCADGAPDAEVTVTDKFSFVTPFGLIGGGFDGEVELTGKGVMPCQ